MEEIVVKPGEIINAIMAAYSQFEPDAVEIVNKVTKEIAKEMAKEISDNLPRRTGVYASGWCAKFENINGNVVATVYNKDRWYLTQLLEYDHPAGKDHHMVRGRPHIEPANKKYSELYIKRATENLQKYFGG